MVAILEKSEHNVDFHPIVDFVEASPLRYALTFKPTVYVSHIRQFWSTARIETTEEGTKILATIDGNLITVFESSISRNLKLNDEAGISSLLDAELFENLTLMGYNISPNQKFTFQKGQFSHQWKYLIHTIMQCMNPKSTGFNEFSSNIATALGEGSGTPTEPHHTPSPKAQQPSPTTHSLPSLPPVTTAFILTVIPSDTPYLSEGEVCSTDSGFEADKDRVNIAKTSTLPYESTSRVTSLAADEGTQELKINSLKARIKLLEDKDRGVAEHFGDDAPIKGRRLDIGEEATERVSDDTKKMATVLTSMDAATVLASGVAEVPIGSGSIPTAGPPATGVPTGSDVLQEYHQFATELPIERRIKLISDLVRYQDNYAKVHKYQSQQRKPLTKKQQREFYTLVLRNQVGWKAKHFKGMTLEEIKENFDPVWKQIDDFIPIGSKEEAERFKRKGIRFEQESAKKLKTSEEVPEEVKSLDEVPKEKVHTEGQRSYWKITRLGGSSASYQFFVDMLKHLDREDLNQLWRLVKESLSIRPPTNDKEMEL
nr:hypothetical protein [Tanacetum cinerariifolium]